MEFLIVSPNAKHENVPGAEREKFLPTMRSIYLAKSADDRSRQVFAKARFWYRFADQRRDGAAPKQIYGFLKRVEGVAIDVGTGELLSPQEFKARYLG
jgi:hypothetical protein